MAAKMTKTAAKDDVLDYLARLFKTVSRESRVVGGSQLRGGGNKCIDMVATMQRWRDSGKPLDVQHYNAALNIMRMSVWVHDVRTMFQWMEADRVRPDQESYSYALKTLAKKGTLPEMASLWKDMRRSGVRPEQECFLAMMKGIDRRATSDGANPHETRKRLLKVFKKLVDSGLEPFDTHYSHLIRYSADEHTALELFTYCFENDIRLDRAIGLGLIKFYGNWCQREEADFRQCYKSLRAAFSKARLTIGVTESEEILRIFLRQELYEEAERVWLDLENEGVQMTLTSATHLFKAAGSRIAVALASHDDLPPEQKLELIRPIVDVATARFGALHAAHDTRWYSPFWREYINVFVAAGDLQGARRMAAAYIREGVVPDGHANIVLRNLGLDHCTTPLPQLSRSYRQFHKD
ncbi:hypothetical protein DIPPA_00261 [Diplonema papillatum]|nr:hypothetical protein DIPPA_00261 [Diplonema papillatum]